MVSEKLPDIKITSQNEKNVTGEVTKKARKITPKVTKVSPEIQEEKVTQEPKVKIIT